MFKRELKVNFKNALIWFMVLAGLFAIIVVAYPFIIDSENMESIKAMMDMFPPEMLKMFNMDLAMIDTAYGWVKTEGFIFILLVISCYASVLGSNILLKEENDKTIEYLVSLPISRVKIVISKMLVGLIYIVAMVVLFGLVLYGALLVAGPLDHLQYILLSITPLFPALVIYFATMFISTFTHKTKKMLGISLGVTFVSYILHLISSIGASVEFVKYFSVFTLADLRNVMQNIALNPIMLAITIVLCGIFACVTVLRYNSKELV